MSESKVKIECGRETMPNVVILILSGLPAGVCFSAARGAVPFAYSSAAPLKRASAGYSVQAVLR